MLSERNQLKTQILYNFTYMKNAEQSKSETESKMVAAGD